MYVDESSPLANITASHPLYPYVKVVKRSSNESDTQVDDSPVDSDLPSSDVATPFEINTTPQEKIELLVPTNIYVGSRASSFRKSIDGTMRVSMTAFFDPVAGAGEYEVRISGVEE